MDSQVGKMDLSRLQESESDRYWQKNDDPFSVGDDVRAAVRSLSADSEESDAEDEMIDSVMRSGGNPSESIPQLQRFITGARVNPVQAARDLEDHYRALPPHALHQPKSKPPVFADDVPDWKQLQETIRWSAKEEERKEAALRAKAEAAPAIAEFRKANGQYTAATYRAAANIHKSMSEDPTGTAPRLPLSFIGDTAYRQNEQAGLAAAETDINEFFERYPGAKNNDRLRNAASKWLQGPEGAAAHKAGVSGQRQLEMAFAHAMGWKPKDTGAGDDVEAAWTAYADEMPAEDTKPKRTYSDAERDVRKAVRQLMGEG